MQVCPAYVNPPAAQRSAAKSIFASAQTITPALPPSSSTTRFLPAFFFSCQPTAVLPVKLSSLMRSSEMISPASSFDKDNTFSPPAGHPASSIIRASRKAVNGVCGAGLRTIVQPAAIAGASLCATRLIGKLNGVIAAIGPSGNLRTMPQRPAVDACQSSGKNSPPTRTASSAATLNVKIARSTSTRDALSGLPASSAMMRANSSRCFSIPDAIARNIRWRSYPPSLRVTSNARTAAAIAASAFLADARYVTPTSCPVPGERISIGSPSLCHLPSSRKPTSSEVVFVNVVLIRSPKIVSRRYASVSRATKNKYEMPRNIPPVQHAKSAGSRNPRAARNARRSRMRQCCLLLLRDRSQRSLDDVKAFVELLVADDERHENANHVVEGAGGDGDEAVLVAILGDLFGLGFGRLASLRVAHQFDGAHAAQPANVADQWPFFLPRASSRLEMFADGGGPREQAVFLDGFDRSERCGTRQRMSAIRSAQPADARRIHDFRASGHRGDGHAAAQRFRHGDHVRFDSKMFGGEPFSRPRETGLHFVGNE